jgi:hypothetical protein
MSLGRVAPTDPPTCRRVISLVIAVVLLRAPIHRYVVVCSTEMLSGQACRRRRWAWRIPAGTIRGRGDSGPLRALRWIKHKIRGSRWTPRPTGEGVLITPVSTAVLDMRRSSPYMFPGDSKTKFTIETLGDCGTRRFGLWLISGAWPESPCILWKLDEPRLTGSLRHFRTLPSSHAFRKTFRFRPVKGVPGPTFAVRLDLRNARAFIRIRRRYAGSGSRKT